MKTGKLTMGGIAGVVLYACVMTGGVAYGAEGVMGKNEVGVAAKPTVAAGASNAKLPNNTVFSEAQLKAFQQTGDPASLGKVMEKRLSKSVVLRYIDKGSTKVIFSQKGTQASFLEFKGNLDGFVGTALAKERTNEERDAITDACNDKCDKYIDWVQTQPGGCDEGDCAREWILCTIDCEDNAAPLVNYTIDVRKSGVNAIQN